MDGTLIFRVCQFLQLYGVRSGYVETSGGNVTQSGGISGVFKQTVRVIWCNTVCLYVYSLAAAAARLLSSLWFSRRVKGCFHKNFTLFVQMQPVRLVWEGTTWRDSLLSWHFRVNWTNAKWRGEQRARGGVGLRIGAVPGSCQRHSSGFNKPAVFYCFACKEWYQSSVTPGRKTNLQSVLVTFFVHQNANSTWLMRTK